jgi:hypothetical protein
MKEKENENYIIKRYMYIVNNYLSQTIYIIMERGAHTITHLYHINFYVHI